MRRSFVAFLCSCLMWGAGCASPPAAGVSPDIGADPAAGVLPDMGADPPARAHHHLVFHPIERVAYLVGGSTRTSDGYHYFSDVWRWTGEDWSPAAPLPFPRASHRLAWDAAQGSLVLFGGQFDLALRADGVVWKKDPEGWRAAGGHFRSGRDEAGLCTDLRRNRVVLFGGWDQGAQYRGETWEWDGATMALVDTLAGPVPRAGAAFAWDPVSERCILFGGRGEDGYLGDTWAWDGSSWRQLDVQGPSARWFAGSATDPLGERIVIFGGRGTQGDLADTWFWNGVEWIAGPVDGPAPRSLGAIAFTGQAILLFGGRSSHDDGFDDRGDTWELRGDTWERVRIGG